MSNRLSTCPHLRHFAHNLNLVFRDPSHLFRDPSHLFCDPSHLFRDPDGRLDEVLLQYMGNGNITFVHIVLQP